MKISAALFLGLITYAVGYPMFTDERGQIQSNDPFCRSCKEKYCRIIPNFCASKGCQCSKAGSGPGPVPIDNPEIMTERGQIQKSYLGCKRCGSDIGFCLAYEYECTYLCDIPCIFLGTPIEFPTLPANGGDQPQPISPIGSVPIGNPEIMTERGQIQKSYLGCKRCGSDIGFCLAYEHECTYLCDIPCIFLGTPIEYPVPANEGGQPQPISPIA